MRRRRRSERPASADGEPASGMGVGAKVLLVGGTLVFSIAILAAALNPVLDLPDWFGLSLLGLLSLVISIVFFQGAIELWTIQQGTWTDLLPFLGRLSWLLDHGKLGPGGARAAAVVQFVFGLFFAAVFLRVILKILGVLG
jgi:hypothetical protein